GSAAEQKIALSDKPTPVAPKAVVQPSVPAAAHTAGAANPTVHSAASNPAPPPAPVLAIEKADVSLNGDMVHIDAYVGLSAVKVIAYFGDKAIMLQPKAGGLWQGEVAALELARGDRAFT